MGPALDSRLRVCVCVHPEIRVRMYTCSWGDAHTRAGGRVLGGINNSQRGEKCRMLSACKDGEAWHQFSAPAFESYAEFPHWACLHITWRGDTVERSSVTVLSWPLTTSGSAGRRPPDGSRRLPEHTVGHPDQRRHRQGESSVIPLNFFVFFLCFIHRFLLPSLLFLGLVPCRTRNWLGKNSLTRSSWNRWRCLLPGDFLSVFWFHFTAW